MAQILVPGVAQLKIQGEVGGNPWNVINHWTGTPAGGSYTQGQLNSMVSACAGNIQGVISGCPTSTTVTEITAVDIGSSQPAQAAVASSAAGVGPSEQDAASCIMFNYPVTQRYRGGKPRSYFPGLQGTDQASPTQWQLAAFDAALTSWQTCISAISQAGATAGVVGCTHCVVLYTYSVVDDPVRHKYIRTRIGVKNVVVLGSAFGSTQIRTQRRRLGAR